MDSREFEELFIKVAVPDSMTGGGRKFTHSTKRRIHLLANGYARRDARVLMAKHPLHEVNERGLVDLTFRYQAKIVARLTEADMDLSVIYFSCAVCRAVLAHDEKLLGKHFDKLHPGHVGQSATRCDKSGRNLSERQLSKIA